MKQVLQNRKTGKVAVVDVPVPALQVGRVLVRTAVSLISSGTERAAVEQARKGLLQEARERPDLMKSVLNKARPEGLLQTFGAVRDKLAASQALGYSASGIAVGVADGVTEFRLGDRVACAGLGFASHAEAISVPKNLCVHLFLRRSISKPAPSERWARSPCCIAYLAEGDKTLPKERVEIFGEGKVFVLDDFRNALLYRNGREEKMKMGKQDKGQAGEAKAVCKMVLEGGPSPITLSELAATTRATFRILDSLRSGQPEKVIGNS